MAYCPQPHPKIGGEPLDYNQQEQAQDLAKGVIQNKTVIDVALAGAAPDADGVTVIHVETERFHGRHTLSDRADRGRNWPGQYTMTAAEADFTFEFRMATMPSEAEQMVETHHDLPQRRVTLPR